MIEEYDPKERKRIQRSVKNFMIWNGNLFRRTKSGPRLVAPQPNIPSIMKSFYNDLGHLDVQTTLKFILVRFWWPGVHRDIATFVRSCERFRNAEMLSPYHTKNVVPLSGPFSIFSIDLSGPLPPSRKVNRYILVVVEHLPYWPVEKYTKTTTADMVI